MSQKVPCITCGELILPDTAERTGGLCMPCKKGTRQSIEAAKKRRAEERNQVDPLSLLWLALVKKVHHTSEGYSGLSDAEKLYFSVNLVQGEVYNGGFHQYFSNSSGSHYEDSVRGLAAMGAVNSLTLLKGAKEALFPGTAVAVERIQRFNDMPDFPGEGESVPEWCRVLDELDKAFWRDPDGLYNRMCKFAVEHGLVSN